jgi:hypothetical protein
MAVVMVVVYKQVCIDCNKKKEKEKRKWKKGG